ncbi:MAG: diguanylate cyclase [Synechococcus sp.]|nr:diguanylate cyclase [Synechococcus sp.]
MTEWRARALLRHYGHRFDYYLVEENGWRVPLGPERALEFQLTPYLHFPGAMVSYDTSTSILFSSDLFGGFVPDAATLIGSDVDTIIRGATPFHQHYMPSTELLAAGLTRIQQRWPRIAMIAPQHGHVVPAPLVAPVFEQLKQLECGVFALADADIDLTRLLRIAEARSSMVELVLAQSDPNQLLVALRTMLKRIHGVTECTLAIELPQQGWIRWNGATLQPTPEPPPEGWLPVPLGEDPPAVLSLQLVEGQPPDPDLLRMLQGIAPALRPWIETVVEAQADALRLRLLQEQVGTDPLTGLRNRRSLDEDYPEGDYALLSFDIDHFKQVNDTCGHAAGDAVLRQVAGVMLRSVRERDRVYRLGGEEFLIVLPQIDATTARAIGERIRAQVKALDLAGLAPAGQVSISGGLYVSDPKEPIDFPVALALADGALYLSKEKGRDRLTVA